MHIREMAAEDMESLAALYYQFWGESSNTEKMREKFTLLQSNSAYIFLCAVEDGRVVGSVMGIVCEELYDECFPFMVLENMVVDSKYRRRGIGKLMFAELERRAKEKGCRQILLVTESDREDARRFYEDVGFHPTANMGFKKKL